MRMCLLRKVAGFNPQIKDLKIIYIQYVRSVLEQSYVLWIGSLTQENIENLERVQKIAPCMYIILCDSFLNYEVACTLGTSNP